MNTQINNPTSTTARGHFMKRTKLVVIAVAAVAAIAGSLALTTGRSEAYGAGDLFYATGTCYPDRVYSQVKVAPVNQVQAYNTFYLGSGWQRAVFDVKLFKWQPATRTWGFVDHSGWIETLTGYLSEPANPSESYYFAFPSAGYYKVAVEIYWLADAMHTSAHTYDWVSHHDSGAFFYPDRNYCSYFP